MTPDPLDSAHRFATTGMGDLVLALMCGCGAAMILAAMFGG